MELFPVWQSKVDLAIEMTIHADAFLTKFLLYFLLVSDYFSCGFASNGSTSGKEKTLAIIKPDGLSGNYTDRIKNLISDSGFTICKERIIQLDEESVMSFYAEHSSRSFFGSLVKYMTRLQQSTFSSGPVLLMILEKENAVADWRALIGPTDASKAKVTHPHSSHPHFQHKSTVRTGFRKKLCSWFRFSSISSKGDFIFL
nr:nucleoside diphosphate kinase isoform X3 [Ziziphus jujuba var. spinosa]